MAILAITLTVPMFLIIIIFNHFPLLLHVLLIVNHIFSICKWNQLSIHCCYSMHSELECEVFCDVVFSVLCTLHTSVHYILL